MNSTTEMLQNSDLCDIVIISNRTAKNIKKILNEAAENPNKWARHHFIVVFDKDDTEEEEYLRNWYNQARAEVSLPIVTVTTTNNMHGKLSSLRDYGLKLGSNPFVYFQDDDDPLPVGLNQRTKMMQNSDWEAVYGVTETVNNRGQIVEKFPPTINGRFLVDPMEANKWFPTYAHPLAAVFKRTLFNRIPYNDDKKYNIIGNAAFFLRILNGGAKITFLADVIRKAYHHTDNTTQTILNEEQRKQIAEDIQNWQSHVSKEHVREFQLKVARRLERGDISTFKEIDSMVETRMEKVSNGISEHA